MSLLTSLLTCLLTRKTFDVNSFLKQAIATAVIRRAWLAISSDHHTTYGRPAAEIYQCYSQASRGDAWPLRPCSKVCIARIGVMRVLAYVLLRDFIDNA